VRKIRTDRIKYLFCYV